jgi:hypothetical protein
MFLAVVFFVMHLVRSLCLAFYKVFLAGYRLSVVVVSAYAYQRLTYCQLLLLL